MKTNKLNVLLSSCALIALVSACDSRPPDADDNEPASQLNDGEDGFDTEYRGLPKGQGGVNGDSDFCNNAASPCVAVAPNEGDCDSNAQCTGGAAPRCGKDNGAKFGTFANFDFCWQAHCTNGVADGDEVGGIDCGGSCGACGVCNGIPGASDFCSSACQCQADQGDCDTDADCVAGTLCGVNNGQYVGLPPNFDVCWPATCENRMQDGTETGVDCGGACRVPCMPAPVGNVTITEIQSNPAGSDDAEFIEIYNPANTPADISNWTLNDWVAAGEANNRWRFPMGATIPARTAIVVTRYNDTYSALYGMNATYEQGTGTRNNASVPNLTAVGGTTLITFADVATGDAVVLRDANGLIVSGVEYGTTDRNVPGTPAPRANSGSSLHRIANTDSSNTSFAITTTPGPGRYPN